MAWYLVKHKDEFTATSHCSLNAVFTWIWIILYCLHTVHGVWHFAVPLLAGVSVKIPSAVITF